MKRLFLAFEIPEIARHLIGAIQEDVRRAIRSFYVTWIPEQSWHITTHFFGTVDEQETSRLVRIVQEWMAMPPELAFWCLTGFPSPREPRVVALRFADPTSRVFLQHDELSRRLCEERMSFDTRTWIPHVSLGRSKRSVARFRESLAEIRVPECSFLPNALTLFESSLDGVPCYRTIATHVF